MPIDTARPRNDAWLGLRAIEANGRGVGPLADIVDVPSPSKFALGDASLEATRQKNWLLANFDPTALFPDEAGTFFFGSRSKVAAQATDATEAEAHVARAVPAHAPSLNADAAASPIPLYTAPARDIPTGANQTLTVGGARTDTIAPPKDAGDFVFEPAFPLPADDFGIIPPPPTHSIGEDNLEELMDHLNRSGNKWDPTDPDGGVTLRIGFPQEYDDIPLYFRNMDGFDTPVDAWAKGLDFFDAQNQDYALQALQAWADMAKVRFEVVAPGEEADIYFYGRNFNDGGAFSSGIDAPHGSRIAINVKNGWPDMQPAGPSSNLLIHEIGHSLGMSHPGHYDVGDYKGYNWDAEYIEDTRMYTVMSYNSGTYTGFDAGGLQPRAITPRSHDAHVIQQLYGPNWDTRADDSTYGYNASGVGDLYDFDNYGGAGEFDPPLFTIWDGGGEDWLDLSGDPSSVTLDLRPGAFSSTHGMTYNISLAYVPEGAPDALAGYIENARGGAGNDSITGNAQANHLVGNDGNDTLTGLEGDDRLVGGPGNDTLLGGLGDDHLIGGPGDDVLSGGVGSDWAVFDDFVLAPVTIDLGKTAQKTGAGGFDTLLSIESVAGTRYADTLKGSGYANELVGNAGNDQIWGYGGNDRIVGGAGNDQLWGGTGADRYEFAPGWGDDRIADFEIGTDKLDLRALANAGAPLKIGVQATTLGTMVSWGDDSILLVGVTALPPGDLLI